MALNAKELLENCAEEYEIFLKKFFNNSYFLNHGNLLWGNDNRNDGRLRRDTKFVNIAFFLLESIYRLERMGQNIDGYLGF